MNIQHEHAALLSNEVIVEFKYVLSFEFFEVFELQGQ